MNRLCVTSRRMPSTIKQTSIKFNPCSIIAVPTRKIHTASSLRRVPIPAKSFSTRTYTTDSNNPTEEIEYEEKTHIRNLAIIAHVDVGKTTLVDCLLKQTNTNTSKLESGKVFSMDSLSLEQERGITIMSKLTTVSYQDHTLNIVDTPGHADFGGEVERIMGMVDGCCLLVDATEGPMTQTKFVLSKALERGLKPVVVINKVDRETARVSEVENEIFELFINMGATDEQMEYPVIYASARQGWAVSGLADEKANMNPLFEAMLNHIPHPRVVKNAPFAMLVSSLDYDRHLGRILTGKIYTGDIKVGDKIRALSREGVPVEEGKVSHLMERIGVERVQVKQADAGQIISIAGLSKAGVTDTITLPKLTEAIPAKPLDPPIMSINFLVNDSPLAGKDGKAISSSQLKARLSKEVESNVALTVHPSENGDAYEVRGRGEMQMAILIENMRREGMEFQCSPPRVLFKENEQGQQMEPIEEVTIDVDNKYGNMTIDLLCMKRGAEMLEYKVHNEKARLVFTCPTRSLIGFGSEYRTKTHGDGIFNHAFLRYELHRGKLESQRKGMIISLAGGVATAYALRDIEARGVLFIGPQTPIYEGMIIGEHSRDADCEVNPARAKHLTNMRASGSEEAIRLELPKQIPLEEALAYIEEDELVEVTPKYMRIRKKVLSSSERKLIQRKQK
ncbi:GTP-binding protein TypA/BipA [Acrasis kona]|uniref:GTP-binding protein TypA/BipA n=1 Tax=Acrasis kona TaxID=1008807 RepID=A0AAW2ZM93_9EUKA